jgi:serine protease Do
MQSKINLMVSLLLTIAVVPAFASGEPRSGATTKPKPKSDKPPGKIDKAQPTPRRPRSPRRWRNRTPQPYSKNHTSTRSAFASIAARAKGSTVVVFCEGKQAVLGTVVDEAGYVLTKASELGKSPKCRLHNGREIPATIEATDESNDVALLKITTKGLRSVQWAPDDNPPVGSWIITPGLDEVPISIGVVSVARRKGPSIVRTPDRGFLGVSFSRSGDAARIEQVIPRTGAARAGLRANDLIVKIDAKSVKGRRTLMGLLRATKPKQEITLRIKRGDTERDISATLGKYPSGGRINPQQTMGGALSDRRTGFESIIQHDSTLKPGECGGPALNIDGKAVGINISRAGRVESYILPASLVVKLTAKLKSAAPKKPQAGDN